MRDVTRSDYVYSEPLRFEYETPEFVMVEATWKYRLCHDELCHVKLFRGPHLDNFFRKKHPELSIYDKERRGAELEKLKEEVLSLCSLLRLICPSYSSFQAKKYLVVPQEAVIKMYGVDGMLSGAAILFEIQDTYLPQFLAWHRAKNGSAITLGNIPPFPSHFSTFLRSTSFSHFDGGQERPRALADAPRGRVRPRRRLSQRFRHVGKLHFHHLPLFFPLLSFSSLFFPFFPFLSFSSLCPSSSSTFLLFSSHSFLSAFSRFSSLVPSL